MNKTVTLYVSPSTILIILILAVFFFGVAKTPTSTPTLLGDGGDLNARNERIGSSYSFDSITEEFRSFVDGLGSFSGTSNIVSQRRQEEAQNLFESFKTREMISPYVASVSLEKARARESNPEKEYLVIKIARNERVSIPVTGWRVESRESGISRRIGTAVYTPVIGQPNNPQPVAASAGDTLYLISGRSPIGYSFLSNICAGFLENDSEFHPSLSTSCPRPEESLDDKLLFGENRFSDQCLSIIERIPRCSIYEQELPPTLERECGRFIKREINYNACVFEHGGTPSFHENEWRLYFGNTSELWSQNKELILLLDAEGRLVDMLVY